MASSTGNLCLKSKKCGQHSEQQRQQIREQLLGTAYVDENVI